MKKILMSIFLLITLCACMDDQHMIKEIENDEIRIEWSYFDRGRERSADYITVTKDDKKELIFEATGTISDVKLKGKRITLKLYKPYRAMVYTRHIKPEVFGYKIVVDTMVTRTEYRNAYKPN